MAQVQGIDFSCAEWRKHRKMQRPKYFVKFPDPTVGNGLLCYGHPNAVRQWNRINACSEPEITFVNANTAKKYSCSVCMDILRNPVTIQCSGGHLFCKNCIDQTISHTGSLFYGLQGQCIAQSPKCPVCRDSFAPSYVRVDYFTKRMIDDLIVKCPNHQMIPKRDAMNRARIDMSQRPNQRPNHTSPQNRQRRNASHASARSRSRSRERNTNTAEQNESKDNDDDSHSFCDWTGEYRQLNQHLSVCQFAIVACEICEHPILKNEKATHRPNCPWLPKQCHVCRISYVQCERHECPLEVTNCEYCNVRISRKNLKHHLKVHCEHFPVVCQYGCVSEVKRRDMAKHLKHGVRQHLALVHENYQTLQKEHEALKQQVNRMMNRLQSYETNTVRNDRREYFGLGLN